MQTVEATTPRKIVLTGGPGAGKTAILETVRRTLGSHISLVPESASLLFRGGFPREDSEIARCAVQRAIFHVQVEMEAVVLARCDASAVLCDRGTVDSLAYWPGQAEQFWREVGTTEQEQLSRYDAVIHLEPPASGNGYHRDAVRHESAEESAAIDLRIVDAWKRHPNRYSVPSTKHFLEKVLRVMQILKREIPGDVIYIPGGV